MSGAHAAPRDRLHPHRKHEGMGRRIARVAPDIGRGIIAGLTFAAVLSTAGSGAQATPEQKSPGIEILTPGMFEHAGAKLGKLARAAAMRQDIASIRSFAFGRARRVILDISEDPIARAYGGNAIGTDPNPKSIDPKETAAYYPEKGGGILEIDADVMFTNPADPGQPRVVDESQEFLLTGTANAGIAKAERRGQLQPTDFLRALGRTGASLVVESVSIAPLDNSTQSLVFSGASITLHGITDGGTAVTPADAGTLLPTFYGNTVAQAQLQQQDYNTAEQERLSEPVMVV